MPLAQISDLPTEILVNILENPTISSETLYFLALLSRRLNHIALPVYFSRTDVDLEANAATVAMHTDRLDHLSALQICLCISSMQRLECIFPHPSCSTIFPFLKQMKRVEAFISRLTSVKEVVLRLDFTPRGRCLALGSDEVLHPWATHLHDLLFCIVERGCTSLAVINGTHLMEAYHLHPPTFLKKHLPDLVRKVLLPQNVKTMGFRRDPKQGRDDLLLAPQPFSAGFSQLNALTIDSITLIMPPGLRWTLAVLNHSPITSLTIRMSLVQPHIWSTILPFIAAACRTLTTISLTELDSPGKSRNAPDETLALAFIARLPRLLNIELTHLYPMWGYDLRKFNLHNYLYRTKGPTAPLRHLTTLRAPANIVAHLLSRPFRVALPAIRAICVLWLAPTHPHLGTLIRFLSRITRTLARRRLKPELSLWIEGLTSCAEDAAVLRGLGASQVELFACVERLHLERAFPPAEYHPDLFLEPVLAAFRGIRQVSMTTYAPEVFVMRHVREIRATELLKSIEVNRKSYLLPSR